MQIICVTFVWINGNLNTQRRWIEGVHQIHWHLQNSWTPLACVISSTCHLSVRWLRGRGGKVHLSFWKKRRARPHCPAGTNVSPLIDGSWSGGWDREESRAWWGFPCPFFIISLMLWHSSVYRSLPLPSPAAAVFPDISCTWLQAVAATKHNLPLELIEAPAKLSK